MRLVIQRVSEASVHIDGSTRGQIRTGLLVLVGISRSDTPQEAEYCADKVLGLRVFPDEADRMNRNVAEAGGSLLVVSQFTLYGDCRKGRRPDFTAAASPVEAEALYNYFVEVLRRGPVPVETGVFRASMEVRLTNRGPVTIWIDSAGRYRK